MQSALGIMAFIAFAWAISEARKKINPRVVVAGIALQLSLAGAMLNFPGFKSFFLLLNDLVLSLEKATTAGTSFAFGYLGGAPLPFDEKTAGSSFILAFKGMPMIIVVSALTSLLFYWRALPVVVNAFAWVLKKAMGLGGAVGLCAAADVFVGMVEGPLFIKPYLKTMTRSELFVIMTVGMSAIAGTVMALYATILTPVLPDAMGHILTASIIHAPAGIMVAHLMIPETCQPQDTRVRLPQTASGAMDAVAKGTAEGATMFMHIIAMLVVLVALVNLVNQILSLGPNVGDAPLTLQALLGYVMAPVVWLIGVPWSEAATAGSLMGLKTVLNEFIAYVQLASLPADALCPRSRMIMVYAMCGFANFGSLGIMIGGLGAMAPERRDEIVGMGFKSILSGTVATCMTGAAVGLVG